MYRNTLTKFKLIEKERKIMGRYFQGNQQKNIARLQKAAQRTSNRLSRCQVVLTKRLFWSFVINWVLSPNEFCHPLSFVTICLFEFCHNLICWVLSQFELVTIWAFNNLSCQDLSFVTIWVFEDCQNLSFVTIWVFKTCYNLKVWVWSQFEFLSLVTIWVLSWVTILVFEFCHNWVVEFFFSQFNIF